MAITTNGGAGSTSNITSSADLISALSDETGTGVVVLNILPTFGTTGVRFSGSTSGTTTVLSGATAGTSVLTLPVATDTLVGKTTTDTLTNKTLTSPILTAPVLGTPASGTLTNATGLPISGLTASTSTALGVGSVELGHATDTTLARASAGVVTIEGVNVVTTSSTDTLTNKTLTTPVISSISNSGTITLPTSTDTLVGRATTDTLTNKTLTSPALTTPTISTYTTSGDLVYGGGSGVITRLGIGSANQYLSVSGGVPAWVTLNVDLSSIETEIFMGAY